MSVSPSPVLQCLQQFQCSGAREWMSGSILSSPVLQRIQQWQCRRTGETVRRPSNPVHLKADESTILSALQKLRVHTCSYGVCSRSLGGGLGQPSTSLEILKSLPDRMILSAGWMTEGPPGAPKDGLGGPFGHLLNLEKPEKIFTPTDHLQTSTRTRRKTSLKIYPFYHQGKHLFNQASCP